MSSIGAAGALPQSLSPLSRLQSELASEVSSGAISASDQSALGSALSDIDSALKSQASSGAARSPDGIKSKIDALIAGEVQDGKLTAAQADELKTVFAKTFQGGPAAGGAPKAHGGGGGGEASKSSTDPADTNGDGVVTAAEQAAYDAAHPTDASATTDPSVSSSDTSSSGSDPSKLISDFLKLLQDAQSKTASYSASGQTAAQQAQSQIVSYQA